MSRDPIDVYVGARIKQARRETRTSQEALADALGITFQQVQKYETAANRISASKLAVLAAKLRRPVGWFFEGVDVAAGDEAVAEASSLQADLVHAYSLVPAIAGVARLTPIQRAALSALLAAFDADDAEPPRAYARAQLALEGVAGHG